MKTPLVKICGITNPEDAKLSLECGADFLGFIFYEKSPRYIKPEDAQEIITKMKTGFQFKSVGVFVNHSKENIERIISVSGIDILQFHGEESPEFVKEFDNLKIKAFRINDRLDIQKYSSYDVDYFLFDTFSKGAYGGTGKSFDWNLLTDISFGEKLFLSGGINAENLSEAVEKINPFSVDLCSSVEKTPGIKDPEKIREFFHNLQKIK